MSFFDRHPDGVIAGWVDWAVPVTDDGVVEIIGGHQAEFSAAAGVFAYV